MRREGWPLLILALVAIGTMLAASLLQPVTWLQATAADGTRLACARVGSATPITLVFTHSMFGGNVTERYRLRDDGVLERQHIVTDNAAAAEYYATDGRIRQVDGGYEVLASPFVTDQLVIRVDARGDHRLTIGTGTYALYDQLQASTRVTLEGRHGPRKDLPDACRTGDATTAATVTPTAQQGLWSPMRGQGLPGSVAWHFSRQHVSRT